MTTRRTFLTTSSFAAAAAFGVPRHLRAAGWSGLGLLDPPPRYGVRVEDPDLKALARRALDAATAAGANYADVRFTVTQTRRFMSSSRHSAAAPPREAETIAVGVRTLAGGAWGFIADTELTPEMMDWLGRSAAILGKAMAWPNRPPIELGARPPAAVGHWEMPVARNPFTVPDIECQDLIQEITTRAGAQQTGTGMTFNFRRQERTFASTDGAFTTQIVYNTFGKTRSDTSQFWLARSPTNDNNRTGTGFMVPIVSPCGIGYEVFEHEKILARLPEWIAQAQDAADSEPLEAPGRFDVVFDAYAMAAIVNMMGASLEADRALGYEANGSGTSYLAPLKKVLGTVPFPAGVTITANRSLIGGVATVQWDDDGVASQAYPLILDGMIVDYATSRQFLSNLSGWYQTRGQVAQSRGCAGSESALSLPLVQTPNLRLQPGAKDLSFDELVAGIDDGLAILGGDLEPDQQQLSAMGGQGALVYRIKKGKRVGTVANARYMIHVPELWKDLVALGGNQSAATRGFTVEKGPLNQSTAHSVQAVAARFRNVVVRGLQAETMFGLPIQKSDHP